VITVDINQNQNQNQNNKKAWKRDSVLKFIISSLSRMKSTTCIPCQAGRQMRLEEEEKGRVLGSSGKIKIKST
jgi:hypothetical protein